MGFLSPGADLRRRDVLGAIGSAAAWPLAARAQQIIPVAPADLNIEHGVRVVVENGPVILRMGSTPGARDVIRQTQRAHCPCMRVRF